ncbi:hypothetical protein T484DRAFT_3119054 [Baffinella frigidus]|nr:hypothetical protein T484DRAFT_3119054 [Cryptophyta sp. CCMP2293]
MGERIPTHLQVLLAMQREAGSGGNPARRRCRPVCERCGAEGDLIPGWHTDHALVCLEREVQCPCRALGCTERMHRSQVAAHLQRCPASVVVCPYAAQNGAGAHAERQGGEDWIFSQRQRPTVWVSGRGVEVRTGIDCGGRALRRSDFARHMLVAHPDCAMLFQGCPFASVPHDQVILSLSLSLSLSSLLLSTRE